MPVQKESWVLWFLQGKQEQQWGHPRIKLCTNCQDHPLHPSEESAPLPISSYETPAWRSYQRSLHACSCMHKNGAHGSKDSMCMPKNWCKIMIWQIDASSHGEDRWYPTMVALKSVTYVVLFFLSFFEKNMPYFLGLGQTHL